MKKQLFLLLIILIPFIAKSQIDTTEIVEINGIRQFLSIQGNDKEQPILLFLHGGPGTSLIESAPDFTNQLKKEFIVVQWDQRETGETLKMNPSDQPLTVDLMSRDAAEVIQHLLQQYNRKKLFLVSHSWGSVLGFDIARNHPDWLYAYIAISAIVDQHKAEKLTVNILKDWAKETKDTVASDELNGITLPFGTEADLFFSQKWLFVKNGIAFARTADFKTNYYKWMDTWFPVWKASAQTSLFDQPKSFNCPVYFMEGNADKYQSHYLVKDYYNLVKAPHKGFYWMTQSGHTVFNTEPDKLQEIIIQIKKETM